MCGFVGFCGGKTYGIDSKNVIIGKMTDKIKHRGPDSFGRFCDARIALGFARLKIIDMTGGDQPFVSEDGRYLLCFNGEIYNYKILKKELVSDFGVRFKSESDTEVLLYTLAFYGEHGLERLRGMYALCFYDRQTGKVLLARDPFGIKPLYYGVFGETLIFASEIKAMLAHPEFKKELNTEVLPYYLQFQYVPTEETAFKGVFRLMPGEILRWENGKSEKKSYFSMPLFGRHDYTPFSFFDKKEKVRPYSHGISKRSAELERALTDSAVAHTVSDAPLGAFLSGGVDSALICDISRPKQAFSVGFEDYGFDERSLARAEAERLGAEFYEKSVSAEEFFSALPKVQYHSDEPYANLSAVPLYYLAETASERVKVVLSGEGADELFGGYEWYFDSFFGKIYRLLPQSFRKSAALRAKKGRIGDFLSRNSGNAEEDFIGQAKIMTEKEAYSLLKVPYKLEKSPLSLTAPIYGEVKKADLLHKKLYLDRRLWLPFDILNKADKMTMAFSLELRVPYLDKELLAVSQGLSSGLMVRGKTGKRVLRKVARGRLGADSANRKKKGFPVPFRNFIRQEKYAEMLKNRFTGEVCRRFFDSDTLLLWLDEHIKGIKDRARKLYTALAFLIWYEVYFSDETEVKERDEEICRGNSRQ